MNTYIAILRGINVSGKNKIKMERLREVLRVAGLQSVQTYIQSGNIIFQTESNKPGELATIISGAIQKEWAYEVPTLVLTREEVIAAKENNPFYKKNPEIDITKLCVTFMENIPDEKLRNAITLPTNCKDFFEIQGKQIFLYCPGGFGRTKLTNNFFERRLEQTCTTRNWKTIDKLIQLSHHSQTNRP